MKERVARESPVEVRAHRLRVARVAAEGAATPATGEPHGVRGRRLTGKLREKCVDDGEQGLDKASMPCVRPGWRRAVSAGVIDGREVGPVLCGCLVGDQPAAVLGADDQDRVVAGGIGVDERGVETLSDVADQAALAERVVRNV